MIMSVSHVLPTSNALQNSAYVVTSMHKITYIHYTQTHNYGWKDLHSVCMQSI